METICTIVIAINNKSKGEKHKMVKLKEKEVGTTGGLYKVGIKEH